ncbi:hypothetical protein V8G54_022073 [Vigna mungo]|uniref:Uncharacterized protein n=1 Tax=Vigna mungo TaxID=3915 RepID=A0AAQ3NFJ8_VIGMU
MYGTITFNSLAAFIFMLAFELTTISHSILTIIPWFSSYMQMKRIALIISGMCLADGLCTEFSSSRSFLKYLANCSCFPGAPKTPANRRGRTHIVESLAVTADLGLKPLIFEWMEVGKNAKSASSPIAIKNTGSIMHVL